MIRPIGQNVLLMPIVKPKISDGGIHIPTSADDNLQSEFVVRAVARKVKEVSPGQRVFCNTYSGREVFLNGIKHRIVEASSILATISPA